MPDAQRETIHQHARRIVGEAVALVAGTGKHAGRGPRTRAAEIHLALVDFLSRWSEIVSRTPTPPALALGLAMGEQLKAEAEGKPCE